MKVLYNKINSVETKSGKEHKLSFNGSYEGLKIDVAVSGTHEVIQDFFRTRRLKHFGQQLDVDIENNQTTIDEAEQ